MIFLFHDALLLSDINECERFFPMHNVTGMCVYAYRMACENGTGTCPQLSLNVDCVNLFNGFKCVCASDGYELNSDDNTCVSKSRLPRSSCLFESQRRIDRCRWRWSHS